MIRMLSIAVLLCVAGATQAKEKGSKEAVQMNSTAPVAEQIQEVERAIGSERYSEISMEEKSAVRQALSRISTLMGEHTHISEVSPQTKTDIFNQQEKVNVILTQAHADSRLVCRRERSTGSNFPQNVCMTVAQRRKAEEAARNVMNNNQRFNNYAPTGGR